MVRADAALNTWCDWARAGRSDASQWVPASSLVRNDLDGYGLSDVSGVRRFCSKYKISTRKPSRNRLEVNASEFTRALDNLRKADSRLGNAADRARTARERRR